MKRAKSDEECEYIWLLDDDNLPAEGALRALVDTYEALEYPDKKRSVALASAREGLIRPHYRAIVSNRPDLMISKNSFFGFNVLHYYHKLVNALRGPVDNKTGSGATLPRLPFAYFGGLFFHKALIDNVGYPCHVFYLYWDDIEWTYRITTRGGAIFLVPRSRVVDIDNSAGRHIVLKRPLSRYRRLYGMPTERVYYVVRNHIYFERLHLVDNIYLYKLNEALHRIILRLLIFPEMYPLVKRAIEDGRRGRF